jgi:SAM-dependent methyltransferase
MQHDRLTQAELDALPDKTKKDQAVVELYMQNNFLTAYSMHTDLRVSENPEGAIGNHLDWEQHGDWQRNFLISRGLMPSHWFLEIGCGTGRLARKLVPWMESGTYWGVDISEAALSHARGIAVTEGWADKAPQFSTSIPTFTFDCIWAFSVFIHLPADVMRDVFSECA